MIFKNSYLFLRKNLVFEYISKKSECSIFLLQNFLNENEKNQIEENLYSIWTK
jgi:hypothetical protein